MCPKVWIVAAGTGGHIYPGLALADELTKQAAALKIEFWGSLDRLEAELIPKHGYSLREIKSSKWKGQGILTKLLSLLAIIKGVWTVASILRREGAPKFLLSVGGYLSVPMGLACRLWGVPVFILEPNSHAGIANRLLSRFANKAFSYAGSDASKVLSCPVENTGVPLRPSISRVAIRPQVQNILIMGGSQGAQSLCKLAVELAGFLKENNSQIKILLQTGKHNYQATKQQVEKLQLQTCIELKEYLEDVPAYYQQVDVVISRAGAMSVQEITACALPAIFIPFPHAADNHQVKNVQQQQAAGAVFMHEESEDFINLSKHSVEQLCIAQDNFDRRQAMSNALYNFANPNSAQQIVKQLRFSI